MYFLLAVSALSLCGISLAQELTLRLVAEPAPVGSSVQIKVFLAEPRQVAEGHLAIDLDPAVFGPVGNVAVFSATGDAMGYAIVSDRHVDAYISSPSATIGQLRDLPVLTVAVPVIESGQTTISFKAGAWAGPAGIAYRVTAEDVPFETGGPLSIRSVTPGGGYLTAGYEIEIRGTGFSLSTTASIEGVSVSSAVAGSDLIRLTLGGATEFSGKRVRIEEGGRRVDYYCSLPSAPSNTEFLAAGIHPLVPLATYSDAVVQWYPGRPDQAPPGRFSIALQNPTPEPVTVELLGGGTLSGDTLRLVRVAPFALSVVDGGVMISGRGQVHVRSPVPIRILQYWFLAPPRGPVTAGVASPVPGSTMRPPVQRISVVPARFVATAQRGTVSPIPGVIRPTGNLPFTATTDAEWLLVTRDDTSDPVELTLKADASNLSAGEYEATLTIRPIQTSAMGTPVWPTILPVSLTVSNGPLIGASTQRLDFVRAAPQFPIGGINNFAVTSNGAAVPFSITTRTNAGGNWLAVSPSQGTTPATITVTISPAGLGPGSYAGQIVIEGPNNRIEIPVALLLFPVTVSPAPGGISWFGNSVELMQETGEGPPATPRLLAVTGQPRGNLRAEAQTESGGAWLAVSVLTTPQAVGVRTDARTLAPGSYRGTILVSDDATTLRIPVRLRVLAKPALLVPAPGSIQMEKAPGATGEASILLESPGGPAQFDLRTRTENGSDWLLARTTSAGTGPWFAPAEIYLVMSAATPGIHRGTITVSWTGGSVDIPVTLTVRAMPGIEPVIGSVSNAASFVPGSLAAGGIFAIQGVGLGGEVRIGGATVSPLAVSASRVVVAAPDTLGTTSAQVQIVRDGLESRTWEIPWAAAFPGVFTANGEGWGQAAATNADGSPNTSENRASRGSVVAVFATGTGTETVTVVAGGIEVRGEVTQASPGVVRVSFSVPTEASAGPAVPVFVRAGGVRSQDGVTIAVR